MRSMPPKRYQGVQRSRLWSSASDWRSRNNIYYKTCPSRGDHGFVHASKIFTWWNQPYWTLKISVVAGWEDQIEWLAWEKGCLPARVGRAGMLNVSGVICLRFWTKEASQASYTLLLYWVPLKTLLKTFTEHMSLLLPPFKYFHSPSSLEDAFQLIGIILLQVLDVVF